MLPTILYGGTFDPVHNGHIAVADAVAEAYQAAVRLIPAADPPHRDRPGASALQRAEMLELAVADHSRLSVDRRELRRGGASFTIDTLSEVRSELGPAAPLIWVLGSDALVGLATWKHWRGLFELAHVLAFKRPGSELGHAWLEAHARQVFEEISPRWCPYAELAARPAGAFSVFQPRHERPESASDVRSLIADDGDWTSLVPAPVVRYIRDRKLYRAGGV